MSVSFKPGDILMNPLFDKDHAEKYHAVFTRKYGDETVVEVRDMGNNNLYMYIGWDLVNLGPYWKNLDIVDDDDLRYYWRTTRKEALKKLNDGGEK